MANNNDHHPEQPRQDQPSFGATDLNHYVQVWDTHRSQLNRLNRVVRINKPLYESWPPVAKCLIQALARECLGDEVFVAINSQHGYEEVCLGTFQSLRDLDLQITQRQEKFPVVISPDMPLHGPQYQQPVPHMPVRMPPQMLAQMPPHMPPHMPPQMPPHMPPHMPPQMPRQLEVQQAENGQGGRKRALPGQVQQSPPKRCKENDYSEVDPIKKPQNMWIVFRKFVNNYFKEQLKGVTQSQKSTWLRIIWLHMPKDMKQLFKDFQDKIAREHKARFPNWKYVPKTKNAPKGSSKPGRNKVVDPKKLEDLQAQWDRYQDFVR
ncbi:hypothetical protein F4809DRAFT_639960 [Biscogniauxia mediterranea]|nr:hypothetical protein F4809DRAFT_639960 [Biscogniauxia mediterranea]